MSDEPTDADIEAILRGVDDSRWHALWDAMEALDRHEEPSRWAGGEVVDTIVVDGVTKPVTQMPYVEYSDAALKVTSCLGGVGAIVPYDWMHWDGHGRYAQGSGLDSAPVADAVRMATAIIRGDRFSEGTIATAIEDGTLRAVVYRLRRWHDHER